MAVLAIGQAAVMGSGVVILACVARVLGAAAVGVFSLGQTLANYTMLVSDMGTRLIGARLAARFQNSSQVLVPLIERKRVALSVASVAIFSIYARFGPVPKGARFFLLLFVLSSFPYCFNLDWLYWGLERFAILAGGQVGRGLLYLILSLLALATLNTSALNGIAGANAVGNGAAALVTYWYWRRFANQSGHAKVELELEREVGWREVFTLGGANLVNLVFQSADVLLLGAMRPATELGHYTAAYKILRIIFSGYYLATSALYPNLARAGDLRELQRKVGLGLVLTGVLGLAVALILYFGAHQILRLIYGPLFGPAEALLRVLTLAVPLELISALLGVTLVSRKHDVAVANGVTVAAIVNIGLNLVLVPRYGALGAAWVTVISYAVYCPALAVAALLVAKSEVAIRERGAD